MVFGQGSITNRPETTALAARDLVNPVLWLGLSLAQLQPGPDRAIPQTVAGHLMHHWLALHL
jgi:hypothetical protein